MSTETIRLITKIMDGEEEGKGGVEMGEEGDYD